MKIEELRHYGAAFSDAEGAWSDELKAKMNHIGKHTVLRSLGPLEKLRFGFSFAVEMCRIARVDISDFGERGFTNEGFLKTQREYISLFSALSKTVGRERALNTMKRVMDKTAPEAMALCFPTPEDMRSFDDPFDAFKAYTKASIEPSQRAGCNIIEIVEDTEDSFRYDMTTCIWLELAKRYGAPDACLPNCYSDDIFLPQYFESFGLSYSRESTLARGASSCDFRLSRKG